VTNKPQTTRTTIRGVKNLPEAQIVFLDTPGLHKPRHELNRRMVRATLSALEGCDLLYLIVDVTQPFGEGDRYVLKILRELDPPIFLLLNKIDLVQKARLMPIIDRYAKIFHFAEILPISALHGEYLDVLIERTLDLLPQRDLLFPRDDVTDISQRFLIAELIREMVIVETWEELPYTTAVEIERVEESEEGMHVWAAILVERQSQKGIVIGKGGRKIATITRKARAELGGQLGCPVGLELWVKVRAKWREQRTLLTTLGIKGK